MKTIFASVSESDNVKSADSLTTPAVYSTATNSADLANSANSAKLIKSRIVTALRVLTAGIITASLLSACSGFSPLNSAADDAHQAAGASAAAQAALAADNTDDGNSIPAIQENLPTVALTDELLYKILTAEIAFQRGNWQAAYVTILSVAQQTRDPRLARRATEIALTVKQPGESLTAIRLWRELSPNSNEATQYYLGFMVMNNNLAEIQNVFSEKLRAADPKQYALLMLQAQRLLLRARDKNAAFDTLEEILAPYKDRPEAHLALAQGAYAHGDNKRAIAEAELVLQAKPDSQLAILTIAQASKQTDAVKAMAAFLEKNPQARDVRLAHASILIDLHQLDKAALEFEELLRDKPNDVTVLYTLGVLAMDSKKPGHHQMAERYLIRYLNELEANPSEERDPTPALINLAQIAIDREDYVGAETWLSRVDSYDGKNSAYFGTQIRRAQLMAKQGKLIEARQFLHDYKPGNELEEAQLAQVDAQLLRDARMPAEATTVLEDALKRFPDNTDLLYDYAMLAESQQKTEEMEVALKRVMVLAPNNQNAYNALGYSLADRNIRLDEALRLIEKASQLAPDDAFILDSLGWVKFRLARLDEAEEALRRAYKLRPDAEIAVHLGEVLWAKGSKDEARKFWHEVKTKDADNESLKSTLQRLSVKL